MLTTVWSVKGGSGVSVIAAALAAVVARHRGDTLLVDLAGDQPAVLGLPEPPGPGVRDWLAAPHGSAEALHRLTVPTSTSLRLLPVGSAARWEPARHADLAEALASWSHPVVVDGGLGDGPARDLARAGSSLLVVRSCYLALRRAVRARPAADGVVLVLDAGRSLDRVDVERVLGLPVRCTVAVDPSVARAVDAGLLASRVPHGLARSLRAVA